MAYIIIFLGKGRKVSYYYQAYKIPFDNYDSCSLAQGKKSHSCNTLIIQTTLCTTTNRKAERSITIQMQ